MWHVIYSFDYLTDKPVSNVPGLETLCASAKSTQSKCVCRNDAGTAGIGTSVVRVASTASAFLSSGTVHTSD